MLFFVAILAIVLLGVAVTLVVRGAFSPANQETVEQISAYGYASNAGAYVEKEHRSVRDWFDSAASWLGERLGRRFSALREREIRARLVSAGLYTTSAARIYGYQFLFGFGAAVLYFWIATLADANPILLVAGTIVCAAAGWVLPLAVVNYLIRMRRDRIERELPDLIDLLVVTIEAGLSFNQGLRLAGGTASKARSRRSSGSRCRSRTWASRCRRASPTCRSGRTPQAFGPSCVR